MDAMAPGLCPEHESMNPNNALHNATHAMKLGEDWLDVPQVRVTGGLLVRVLAVVCSSHEH